MRLFRQSVKGFGGKTVIGGKDVNHKTCSVPQRPGTGTASKQEPELRDLNLAHFFTRLHLEEGSDPCACY